MGKPLLVALCIPVLILCGFWFLFSGARGQPDLPAKRAAAAADQAGGAILYPALFPAEWRACASKTDCAAVHGGCGEWQPVNGQHKAEAEAYYQSMQAVVRCIRYAGDEPVPSLACMAGQCVPYNIAQPRPLPPGFTESR